MLIAQLTDTHIKPAGETAYGKVDTAAFLRRAIQHLNALRPAVAAVFVTGDLADRGLDAEYALLADILADLTAPVYLAAGNHDRRAGIRAAFPGHDYLKDNGQRDDGFIHYAVDLGHLRAVVLDSSVPGQPYGRFCPARLDWLESTLAQAPDRPTLIFQHHPPFKTGIRHMDVQNLQDAEAFLAVLARHPQVAHVACGHVHRASETVLNGIGISIAPSPAHAVTLDLDPNGPASFTMEPPLLRLFHAPPGEPLVSHLSPIGAFDGPHPFFAEDGNIL
ncbi:phosphodiesterase [Fodinicurvata fenggangensis]|uniref:phosphodiesterase n=1 Tax=Fodinicurvata fenggangensis TaxID=1121830 RepID=UPI00047DFF74|nr:phosphodiesterase [Fodinicurvata fenggangensis]